MRLPLLILVFVSFVTVPVHAQDAAAGASYTFLSLTYPDQTPQGFGGWLTWRFVDIGANFFPEDHPITGRQTLDLGGTFEVLPGSAAVILLDVGDTLIRFARTSLAWQHNLQVSAGAGIRF